MGFTKKEGSAIRGYLSKIYRNTDVSKIESIEDALISVEIYFSGKDSKYYTDEITEEIAFRLFGKAESAKGIQNQIESGKAINEIKGVNRYDLISFKNKIKKVGDITAGWIDPKKIYIQDKNVPWLAHSSFTELYEGVKDTVSVVYVIAYGLESVFSLPDEKLDAERYIKNIMKELKSKDSFTMTVNNNFTEIYIEFFEA